MGRRGYRVMERGVKDSEKQARNRNGGDILEGWEREIMS